MANYVNRLPEPVTQSQRDFIPNMLAIKQYKQNKKTQEQRNALAQAQETREQTKYDISLMTVPFEWQKMKASHVKNIAGQISGLPTKQRNKQYANMVTKVVPMPITTHQVLGPLGALDPNDFLDPEVFSEMTDRQQKDYLRLLTMDADQMTKLNLSDADAQQQLQQMDLKHRQALAQIQAKGELSINEEAYKQQGRIELEGMKQSGNLLLEQARQQGRTELEKTQQKNRMELAKTSGQEKNQGLIDKYRKELVRIEQIKNNIDQSMAQLLDIKLPKNPDAARDRLNDYEEYIIRRLKKLDPTFKSNPLELDLD